MPHFYYLSEAQGEGMGFFERPYLSDLFSSALCCGPSRGLRCNGLMVSTTFRCSRLQRGPLHLRSRYGLEKSAVPNLLNFIII
jgi:hypothetical protein